MVCEYRETSEDQALTNACRLYDGRLIDTRWSGGWLTPAGMYFPVDYSSGLTHEVIAGKHAEMYEGSSGSIMSTPPVIRMFNYGGWMRITYFKTATFCVELKGTFTDKCCHGNRQRVMLRFASHAPHFDSYFINDDRYDTFLSFIRAIRMDIVRPVQGEAGSHI